MNALRVETCILYMYFKETSLISHASLESWNKESINQTVATTAEGDPQYHFYKVTGKQNTSELITDDYGTEFPQTLISYKAILSQRKFYRHDLQSWQENVCSGCPVEMVHIWNMKWMEQRKAEQRGPKLFKLTTEQQEESLRTSWATCK